MKISIVVYGNFFQEEELSNNALDEYEFDSEKEAEAWAKQHLPAGTIWDLVESS